MRAKRGSPRTRAVGSGHRRLFLRQGSGLGVLAACRDRVSEQKMVVLSNYATPTCACAARSSGVDAVFDKSNEIDALVDYCIVHGTQRASRRRGTGQSISLFLSA